MHDCPFKFQEEMLNRVVPLTVLRPPKHRDRTKEILNNLPFVERLKLCMMQAWCVPDVYPFCFFGSMRIGSHGIPPIFSALTAARPPLNVDRLREYLSVEQTINLPKEIIIFDDERNHRMYLPPNILRPSQHEFSVIENDSSFDISLHPPQGQASQSQANTGVIDSDAGNTSSDDDDGHDGNDVQTRSPSPAPGGRDDHPACQLIPDFQPGRDGLGAVDGRFKKMNSYRKPWELDNQDFLDHINIHKTQFFDIVQKQSGCQDRRSELNIFSEVFLWMLKLTKGLSNALIRSMFALNSEEVARQIFIRQNIFYYLHNVNIPSIVAPDGSVNNAERRKLYDQCYAGMSPLHRRLAANIRDPSGRNRRCVIINVDGSYIDIEGMSDIEHQKFFFYPPRSGHVVKFLNFTSMDGKILMLIPITTSSSPSGGDGFQIQKCVGLEDNGPSESSIRTLLAGDDENFVCMVSDAGFVVRLRNQPTQIRDCPNLTELCKEHDAVHLHTSTTFEPYILEKDQNGMFHKVEIGSGPEQIPDTGLASKKTQIENTIKFTRLLRMVQENVHASLKKTFAFFDAKKFSNTYLKPFSKAQQKWYKFPRSHEYIPKLSVFLVVGCSLLNEIHPGYRPLYLSEEDQEPMADCIIQRMSLENPLLYEDLWPLNFNARNEGNEWSSVKVAILEYVNEDFLHFPLPLNDEFRKAAIFLVGGIHALLKTNEVLTYINKLHYKDSNISPEELIRRCSAFPVDMVILYSKIKTPEDFVPTDETPRWIPDWWNEELFGEWHDCTVAKCRIPPSMKSATSGSNFHNVVICYGDEPSNRLGLLPPFDKIYGWRCLNCPAKTGSVAMDRHCATLLCALAFRHTYISKARHATVLNPVALDCRQGMTIMPPSDHSADIPVNIPRHSVDSRSNNPFYPGEFWNISSMKSLILLFVGRAPSTTTGGAPQTRNTTSVTRGTMSASAMVTAAPTSPSSTTISIASPILPPSPSSTTISIVSPSAAPSPSSTTISIVSPTAPNSPSSSTISIVSPSASPGPSTLMPSPVGLTSAPAIVTSSLATTASASVSAAAPTPSSSATSTNTSLSGL